MIGVNVVQEGTTNGTITDANGTFSLDLPSDAVLLFSYIGYESQRVKVNNKTNIIVRLLEDTQVLDELVVVSYGTQKKRDLTGSISKVNSSSLNDLPVGQIGQKLQGQVAGVQINQVSGTPGSGIAFRIRGSASINGSAAPLFVVDGIPVSTGLENINPDEIETFSILKDAAATSLYGSRAANGVILITTKKGKIGKMEVTLNANFGIQSIKGLGQEDLMNARDFAQYQKEFYEDKAKYEGYTGGVPIEYQNPEKYGEGTNWLNEMTRTAPIQNYSLGVTFGNEKYSSAINLGYFKQDGVMLNTGFERISLRANNDYQINDRVKVGLNIAPVLQLSDIQEIDGHRAIMNAGIVAPPHIGPYDENGELRTSLNAAGMFPQVNWVRALKERTNNKKVLTLLSNAYVDIDIWKGIKYKFQAGVDLGNSKHRTFTPSTAAGGFNIAPPQKAEGSYETSGYYNWTIDNMLTYTKKIGEHNIDLLLGYTAQKSTTEMSKLEGTDFPGNEIGWLDAAATITDHENYQEEWSLASVIARLSYSFKERYLLQATFRRDGCSRFAPNNKYANFPSVSAGWIISDEAFMKKITPVMNYAKLRLSYGLTGNYNIGNYAHFADIQNYNYTFGGSLVSGTALGGLPNYNLTWEETSQFDLGIDIGFLNDRIYAMYDFYNKRTTGMLYPIDIPQASGFSDIQSNIGDFRIWGHEFTITSRNLVGNFKWTTNFNIAFSKSKVLKLGTNDVSIGAWGMYDDFNRLQVGEPIGILVGYVFDGVYMNQEEFDRDPKHYTSEVGTVRMKDIDKSGEIDDDDKTKIGDPNPDFIYGLTNEFKYKNFDLSILVNGQVGGDVMNANYANTDNLDGVFNVRNNVKNRWRSPEKPGNGLVPRTLTGTTELYRLGHSGQVFDASYLSIRNITLGYTVPLKSNSYISRLRVYATVQNLAMITKYPGMNPEVTTNTGMQWNGLGVDKSSYPVPRSFNLGISVSF